MELAAVVRKFVEAVSNLLVRLVKVDRTRTPQEAISATGRAEYLDNNVVKAMPHGEGEKTQVVFFNVGRQLADEEADQEYELHGLKSADPYSLAAVNEADPAFADTHPNCTHWKDANGKWCYIAFRRWDDGKRGVNVSRYGRDWHDFWWFGGLRK
jgi:hypothetical protein